MQTSAYPPWCVMANTRRLPSHGVGCWADNSNNENGPGNSHEAWTFGPPSSRLLRAIDRGPIRILLAEDHIVVRQLIARILDASGYQVSEAANGGEALTIWAERFNDIDLLLTDVNMPLIDGATLTECVWRDAPWLPVVF